MGWVLSGPDPSAMTQSSAMNLITTHILTVGAGPLNDHDLNKTLRSFGELEPLGIKVQKQRSQSINIKLVLKMGGTKYCCCA